MELVDDRQMCVQAVQRAPFRALRLEGAVGARHIKRIGEDLEPELALQSLAHSRHFLGISPDDLRLVAGRGERVHLGARLSVGKQAIKPDAGEQRALAVAARHLDIGTPEPAVAVVRLPAEHRRQDEHLPRLEPDPLPPQLALRVRQQLDEAANPASLGFVKPEGAVSRGVALQVLDLPAAREAHPFAGSDPARQNIGAVLLRDAGITTVRSLRSHCPSREPQARGPVRDWRG